MTLPSLCRLDQLGPADTGRYGQKAALLGHCLRAGERVPPGFALAADAPELSDAELRSVLAPVLDALSPDTAHQLLAVRASPAESLPGALLTKLHVPSDLDALLAAVREVLASGAEPAAKAQLAARGRAQPPALAVLIQSQVAARAPDDLGAVVFTRDPDRGERRLTGEWLPAVGVDQVVAGRRVPWPLSARGHASADAQSLERREPAVFAEVQALAQRLEQRFDEPLELELARVGGVLWLLQVRPLVMSARACVRAALEAIEADSPSFRRFTRRLLDQGLSGLLEHELPPPSELAHLAHFRGLSASPGVGCGTLVLDAQEAIRLAAERPVVLMRAEVRPEDVAGCRVASAIVTTGGGLTSHAAVVARGLRVPAVVGCSEVRLDAAQGAVLSRSVPSRVLARAGDLVSVDAHRGLVYLGALEARQRLASPELKQLLLELRKLRQVALWARGPARVALAAKEDVCLDGIVCPVTEPEDLPPARGRECWAEVSAERALELVPRLPASWGVVVRGCWEDIPLAELRKLSRLRPLGVHLTSATLGEPPGFVLDLAMTSAGVRGWEAISQLASRFILALDSAQNPFDSGHSTNRGILCETHQALEWALQLPSQGALGTG